MSEVRRVVSDDIPYVASTLARAFVDDPIAGYVFPSDQRREQGLQRFFALQIRHHYLPRGEVYTNDLRSSVALWVPPGARPPSAADRLAYFLLVPTLGTRYFATCRLAQLLLEHHPRRPHYYLGTLGTDPKFQRQGEGSALVQQIIDQCDRDGIPAYLECSRIENVVFYSRHGFAVTKEVDAPDGGPPLWLMWRKPQPSVPEHVEQ